MNRDLEQWQERALPHNSTIRLVVLAMWPDAETKTAAEQSRLYGDVKDVFAGHPTPTRSRAECERILELLQKELQPVHFLPTTTTLPAEEALASLTEEKQNVKS